MAETKTAPEHNANLIQGAREALAESLEEIGIERREFAGQAQRLKRLDGMLNVFIVLVGVAAPALVTYLTQQDNPTPQLAWQTIVLVGVAGAAATLRVVLRWGEKYSYTVMTAMKMRELESNARLDMEEILHTANDAFIYGKLSTLNREIQEEWTAIIHRHLVSGGHGGEGSDAS